jgi:uncharacterized membrane protein YedE/YeeE
MMGRTMVALAAGLLFGAGLALAEMTNPAKVLAFLDVAGAWDPSLAFVMGGGLAVMAVAWQVHGTSDPPLRSGIDARLVAGAALFGLGWGLAGLCPGPALAVLSTGSPDAALFVAAMVAGILLHRALRSRLDSLPGGSP